MKYMVFDSHCDTPFSLWRKSQRLEQTDCHISLQGMEQLSGYAQFFAFCSLAGWKGGYTPEELLKLPYAYFMQQLDQNQERVALCRSSEELDCLQRQGKAAAFLSMEGAECVQCDPGRLDDLAEMGLRMVSLTWNENNALAGCSHRDGPGLSAQGKEFVRRAQRLGMIVDLSHISDRAFYDVLDCAEKPVVASHSNSRTLCGHSRNLTDHQYRALCQHGGYTGINLFAAFLADDRKADFETVYRHVDHFFQLAGDSLHVALGGDLDGCDVLPDGFSGVQNYNNLASCFEQKGFNTETIRDVYSNTMKRIVKQCIT